MRYFFTSYGNIYSNYVLVSALFCNMASDLLFVVKFVFSSVFIMIYVVILVHVLQRGRVPKICFPSFFRYEELFNK